MVDVIRLGPLFLDPLGTGDPDGLHLDRRHWAVVTGRHLGDLDAEIIALGDLPEDRSGRERTSPLGEFKC